MKKNLLIAGLCLAAFVAKSQKKEMTFDNKTSLRLSSNEACKCIGSINTINKSKEEISKQISDCIDKQVVTYEMGDKLFGNLDINKEIEKALKGDTLKKKNKKPTSTEININTNQDSKEYKEYYYKLERFMMDSCSSMKYVMAANDKVHDNSVSDNPKAMELYSQGIKDMQQENYQKATIDFEAALKIDPSFAFAWDNLGLSYRHLENYDKAIQAYNSSLKIDPNGVTPLQNIAVAYEFKKQYDKSIEAYERLAKIDKGNPETFYGIGRVYAVYLQDYENGLQNLCKAYNLYIEQKSPYRTDAESMISMVYKEMKKVGKEKRFNEILKENHISTE